MGSKRGMESKESDFGFDRTRKDIVNRDLERGEEDDEGAVAYGGLRRGIPLNVFCIS